MNAPNLRSARPNQSAVRVLRRIRPWTFALLTVALVAQAMVMAPARAQEVSVSEGKATADAYVVSSKSRTNYGTSTLLKHRVSGPVVRSFLRFNLPPIEGTVNSATLKVYTKSSSSVGLEVRPVIGNWEERTVTYSNAPAVGAVVKKTGAFSSGKWVSIDVTPLVSSGLVNLALTTPGYSYVSLSSRESSSLAPNLSITTTIPAPEPTGLPIGLSYGDTLPGLSAAALDARLTDAAAIGATWVRADLGWDRVQPTSSTSYDWSGMDRTVQVANAKGLKVLPILSYTPAWARPAGCSSTKCAPADPNQFATFASEAARRYAPLGVHNWEVWNEPNITNFWLPTPDVTQYVALLKASSAAIRAADPSAMVISAGLSPAPTDGKNISQRDYVEEFSRQGGPGMVDAVGYHPYSYPVPPGYQRDWNAWTQISTATRSFQSILESYGYAGKKLWLTEYGAPTNGPGVGATSTDYKLSQSPDHVDEELQAIMATDSVALAKGSPIIGALFWYSYADLGTDTSDRENFFGLRRHDGSPKPAYEALKTAIAREL